MKVKQEKQGKQGETRRRVSVRRRGDPGEIQGRSKDLRGSVFRGVGGGQERGQGGKVLVRRVRFMRMRARGGLGDGRGEDESRTVMRGGVLGSSVGSDEGC